MSEHIGQWQTVEWQPVVAGITRDVPIKCLVGELATKPGADPIFVFPGYGEEERSIRSAVKVLESRGIPSIGVNLPDAYLRDKATIELSSREAPQAVARTFNELSDKAPDSKVDVVAHSKGAGALLVAANETPEQFGALGLIGPIGVTNEFLGRTPNSKILNYFWRIAVLNNLEPDHNVLKDPSNFLAFYEVASRVGKDAVKGTLKTKLDIAFGLDLAKNVRHLSETNPLRLYLGTGDRLFTTDEYRMAIGDNTYEKVVEEITGSHTPVVNKLGRQHIALAGDWIVNLRSQKAKDAEQ